MSAFTSIDPDLLRAFSFIAEEGSFTRAAERVGRTQSAVSMQIQRLEQMLGQKLLQRGKGGSVQLTPHGTFLLDRARELLALNDSIWSNFQIPAMRGVVKLGIPDDYALRFLPPLLRRFADTHPAIEVDVMCAPSSQLAEKLKAGDLDLALVSEGLEPRGWPAVELWRGQLHWITSERYAPHRRSPLPVAVAHENCAWREAALGALERAGLRYRVAYTSATQTGTHAPVMAGLAVAISTMSWPQDGLRVVRSDEGLPELPDYAVLLLQGRDADNPVTQTLTAHITETFRSEMQRQDR
jgi:molybdate transport repressor ModE-like protein